MVTTYNAQNIKRLEGLEAVRRLPGMYIGNNSLYSLHHILVNYPRLKPVGLKKPIVDQPQPPVDRD